MQAGEEVLAFNPTLERGYVKPDDFGTIGAGFETNDDAVFTTEIIRRFNLDKNKRRFLIIDEAHEFFSRKQCQYLWIGSRGRHYGLNIIGITQRGASIHPTFRSQCSVLYLFQCSLTDAKFLSDEYGNPALLDAPRLERGKFYKIDHNGLTTGKVF